MDVRHRDERRFAAVSAAYTLKHSLLHILLTVETRGELMGQRRRNEKELRVGVYFQRVLYHFYGVFLKAFYRSVVHAERYDHKIEFVAAEQRCHVLRSPTAVHTADGAVYISGLASGPGYEIGNGAREYRRVNKILATIAVSGAVLALLGTLIMVFWPDAVYGIFTPDTELLRVASVLTFPIILNLYGAASRSVAFSLINGSGRSGLNLAVALIDGVIARIGLAALLGFALHLDCYGFWMGDTLAGFMPLAIGLVFYCTGKWQREPEARRG